MFCLKSCFLLQILSNLLVLSSTQWCVKFGNVAKTRIQWNNGQRMVSKRNFFGGIKYKYEPYVYSTTQYYTDYERINVCCVGHEKVSDTKCEPICLPSCPTNTHCIRPNICECDEGYRGYTSSALSIICYPICQPSCGENAQCTDPNKCTCDAGYADNGWGNCKPICSKECPENSKCTKPNECTCNQGYLDNGLGNCEPVCTEECTENSKCTQPEICSCLERYEMIQNKCQPICDNKCPENSLCVKPNLCDCLEGYEKIEKDNDTFKCVAKCSKDCPENSYCYKPNECHCNKGFKQTPAGLCEPICESPSCPENSICSEPNKCSCLKGYQMLANQCHPICDKSCPENSFCTKPNKCDCEAGYQMKLTSIYNLFCEPICQSNCSSFAKCVQPNKCECLEGYEVDEMQVCQPVCSRGCQNGLCFLPDVCICNSGYLMGPNEQCEPTCSLHCYNGSCVEPEICQCHDGYQLKEKSINICEPICDPPCVNGICAEPNICICHENYEPIETDLGLNHSHCQIMTTTIFDDTTSTEAHITEIVTETEKDSEIYETSTLHSDQLLDTTTLAIKPSIVSSEICSDICQCWQEYDDFGPLANQQCSHICMDSYDQPCINLTLCQCDITKTHLICRPSEDSLENDDPILYMCKIQRFRATTSKSVDEKIIGEPANSNSTWIWLTCIAVIVIVTTIVGALLYTKFQKHENPILEYEL